MLMPTIVGVTYAVMAFRTSNSTERICGSLRLLAPISKKRTTNVIWMAEIPGGPCPAAVPTEDINASHFAQPKTLSYGV